jgi:hypothetical protein
LADAAPSLNPTRLDPQRLAWGVILISFAVFCVLCLVAGIGVNYFLFQSNIPMESEMIVGRGTGAVAGQAAYDQKTVSSGDDIRTDPQSQVTLFFYDPQSNNRLVASLTLRGGSSARLRRAVRPRFDWSSSSYEVELQNFTGEADIFVVKELSRNFRMTVTTLNDVRADVGGSGQYSLNVSDARVKLVNLDGLASLIPLQAQGSGRVVPVNGQAVVYLSQPNEVIISSTTSNLLANNTFQEVVATSGSGAMVTDWGCYDDPTQYPAGSDKKPIPGEFLPEVKDGRATLRIVRDQGAEDHGETHCLQYFGQNRRDVTAFTYLAIRATFNINYQSLSACGQTGSECPLMLKLDYIDRYGRGQQWLHGFYARTFPGYDYPLRCLSCALDHEQVNEKAWYTYDSGNLFTLLPDDQKPSSIVTIHFYVSGHQYDVYVGDVSLLAGQAESLPPVGGS